MSRSASNPWRQVLLATTCAVGIGSLPTPLAAGGVSGFSGQGGTLSRPDAQTTVIHQTAQKAIFTFSSFDIAAGTSVIFQQPNSSAVALNRVTGGGASQLFGSLSANGKVWIINPNGVIFGPSAEINVGSFLATTADIADGDFLAGTYNFSIASTNPAAGIVNQGSIHAAPGGSVVLAAPRVDNQGLIVADAGTVVLAGGKSFAVDFNGDRLLRFEVTAAVDRTPLDEEGNAVSALVANEGRIEAAGGKVLLTARAAKNVVDNVINTSGIIEATTAHLVNGEIVLDGGDAGAVQVSGTLDASGKGASETGGAVKVVGEAVVLAATAKLDVSGDSGGGTAEVGGQAHGAGKRNAQVTLVAGGALIDADALSQGNGGQIVVWSQNFTEVDGTLSARGGALSGNGGSIETSSKGQLGIAAGASISTAAAHGQAGQWLLDPFDVTIASSAVNVSQTAGSITPTASGAVVDASVLDAALNAGTSIAVLTDSTPGGEAGNITVSTAITMTASPGPTPTLTLKAAGNVFVDAPITTSGGTLAVVLGSGALGPTGSINLAADIVANSVTLNANGPIGQTAGIINTLGGSLTASSFAGANLPGANLIGSIASFTNSGSGDVLIGNAQALSVNGPINAGPGSLILSVSQGALTVTGTLTAQTGFNFITDQISVGGSIVGPGPVQVSAATPGTTIDLAGGTVSPGTMVLDTTTLAALTGGSPAALAIAGTGPINVVNPVTIDVPLTLIGSDVALGGLAKTVGPLFVGATGSVTGAVTLGSGTGTLSIASSSTNISGTVNGLSGAAAAADIVEQPTSPATGPFLVNGVAFANAPSTAVVAPLVPANLIPIPPPPTPQPSVAALPSMDPLAPAALAPPETSAATSAQSQQAPASASAGDAQAGSSAPPPSQAADPQAAPSGSPAQLADASATAPSGASAGPSSSAPGTAAAPPAATAALLVAAAPVTMFNPIAPPLAQPVADPAAGDGGSTSGDALAKALAQPLRTKPASKAEGKEPAATKVVIRGLVSGLRSPSGGSLPRGTTSSGDYSIWGNDARW
jgi:filamentous hemagglutinin family protein